jgi:hypothetical protein
MNFNRSILLRYFKSNRVSCWSYSTVAIVVCKASKTSWAIGIGKGEGGCHGGVPCINYSECMGLCSTLCWTMHAGKTAIRLLIEHFGQGLGVQSSPVFRTWAAGRLIIRGLIWCSTNQPWASQVSVWTYTQNHHLNESVLHVIRPYNYHEHQQ